jgi:hypothetical protein
MTRKLFSLNMKALLSATGPPGGANKPSVGKTLLAAVVGVIFRYVLLVFLRNA